MLHLNYSQLEFFQLEARAKTRNLHAERPLEEGRRRKPFRDSGWEKDKEMPKSQITINRKTIIHFLIDCVCLVLWFFRSSVSGASAINASRKIGDNLMPMSVNTYTTSPPSHPTRRNHHAEHLKYCRSDN